MHGGTDVEDFPRRYHPGHGETLAKTNKRRGTERRGAKNPLGGGEKG